MNLEQALRIFHIIWLRGEPIIGVSRAQQALNELINNTPPKTWVMATGLGDPNKNENWGSATVKQPIAAEQELIGALLDAGKGETPVGSGKWPPGLVVLAEGLKLGAHVQAAAMKIISGDGRVIFVSSGDPPEDFLKDYLKIVDLEYDTLSDDLGEICRNNSRQFSEEMVSVLTGLRPYRSASVLAESIAMTEANKELPYIYMSRGDAIRDDSDGIITYLEPTIKFKDLIGLDRAKRLFTALSSRTKTTEVRGVLLLGIPGCLRGDTIIYDPIEKSSLTVRDRYIRGIPFHVTSQDVNGDAQVAVAMPPHIYPKSEIVKLTFSDGSEISVTWGHKIWNGVSYVSVRSLVGHLQEYGYVRLPSTWEHGPLMSLEDDQHFHETIEDSASDYRRGHHSCDALLPSGLNIYPNVFPSQDGVLKHSRQNYNEDDWVYADRCIRLFRQLDHRPRMDFYHQTQNEKAVASQLLIQSIPEKLAPDLLQEPEQLPTDVGHLDITLGPASYDQVSTYPSLDDVSLFPNLNVFLDGKRHPPESYVTYYQSALENIPFCTKPYTHQPDFSYQSSHVRHSHYYNQNVDLVKWDVIGVEEYFDFHVPNFENYWACGMFHHNCGKTSLALAAAGESKSPLYFVDVGSVFNALVGRSEERARRAIQVLKKAPSGLVLMDELEKSLSGSSQGGAEGGGGHGTSIRAGMYFLQYLDNPVAAGGDGRHVVIGTSNDIFSLPPEFTRAGRWDAIFSFLLPTGSQLKKVLALYRKQYNLPVEFGKDADLTGLTPAEVEAGCRIASILQTGIWEEAIEYVPRLSKFRSEDIQRIQSECLGRAVSADDDDAIGKLVSKSRKVKR